MGCDGLRSNDTVMTVWFDTEKTFRPGVQLSQALHGKAARLIKRDCVLVCLRLQGSKRMLLQYLVNQFASDSFSSFCFFDSDM